MPEDKNVKNFLVCPFQYVPVQATNMVLPSLKPHVDFVVNGCLKENCAIWDAESNQCSFKVFVKHVPIFKF